MKEMVDVKLIVPIKCSTIHKLLHLCWLSLVGAVLIFIEFFVICSAGIILNYPIVSTLDTRFMFGLVFLFFTFIFIQYINAIAYEIFKVKISIDCIRNGA